MRLTPKTPSKSLDPAYKLRPEREQIERFKDRFKTLFGHIDERESEENVKDHLMDFLKEVYYKESYVVAPKGKTDFVIHLGKDAASPAGVLFEVKRPANRSEMVSRDNLNTKAFHELLLYYFQERTRDRNSDLRHCVVTNVYEWYIFDAALIDRVFYRNAALKKEYTAWASGQKVSRNNDLFYNEIAKPFLAALDEEIPFTYFDLRTYQKNVEDHDPTNDKALLPLYKVLSPAHLLKLPAAPDSNRLNPRFYTELLHLIGLEETRDGNKKVIRRKAAGQRDEGSLLENTIMELEVSGKLSHLTDPGQYGRTHDEQLFSVALELCITWVNRILFLKLLESQLVKYHRGDRAYAFLNRDMLADFDEVYRLFFRVLARRPAERQGGVRQKFGKVPYLNSSLFEITELEDTTLGINTLDSSLHLPLLRQSVLRDHPAYRDRAELPTLGYLFAFLDAYDFASESGDDIQEKNRALINASVLGLIFEKINGYRDGSFYTPGFITEYMCRETIRRAVVQKFNEAYGWHCADFIDLQNKDFSIARANELIDSLRICDPAVGSGHFLVSALNELIAIKSELGVLRDDAGLRLKGYLIRVVNDELLVLDEDDGEPFAYVIQKPTGRPTTERPNAARQRVQRVLFHEKQVLIENCLFGVDINPNSVKICRLRLWIELLKNAYYTEESGFAELETLPNIDINIKQGNSLLSKFSLSEDLSDVFRKQKFSLSTYRNAVAAYKSTADKDAKAELLRFIHDIKEQFRETVVNRDPRRKRLSAKRGERMLLDNNVDVFGNSIKDPALVAVEKKRLDKLIAQIENEIADVENNALYRGSFEWRFEFPEVLDEEGNYVGFDVVIGNPPYIRQEELGEAKVLLKKDFPSTFAGTADLYVMFVEHGLRILRPQGYFVYIIPNKWMRAGYGAALRRWLKTLAIEQISDFGDLPVFEEATTYPCLLSIRKAPATERFWATPVDTLDFPEGLSTYLAKHRFEVGTQSLQDDGWQLSGIAVQNLMAKLRATGQPLGEYVDGKIFYGIKTGLNEAFVIDATTRDRLIAEDPRSADLIKPFLAGRDIKRYQTPEVSRYLILFKNGSTREVFGTLSEEKAWGKLSEKYPAICEFLEPFEKRAKARYDQGEYWWELRACAYYEEFEKPKIMYQEICTYQSFGWSDGGIYCNNKIFILPEANPTLLAVLNAKTTWFFLNQTTSKLMGGALAMQSPYVKAIPIPRVEKEGTLAILAKKILQVKSLDPAADTTALEAEIDQLVYTLYGLTAEEVALVEG